MFVGVELGDSPLDAFDGVPGAQACQSRCDANRECAAWNFHVSGTQKSECWRRLGLPATPLHPAPSQPAPPASWTATPPCTPADLGSSSREGTLRARAREGAEPAAAQDVPEVVVIAQ